MPTLLKCKEESTEWTICCCCYCCCCYCCYCYCYYHHHHHHHHHPPSFPAILIELTCRQTLQDVASRANSETSRFGFHLGPHITWQGRGRSGWGRSACSPHATRTNNDEALKNQFYLHNYITRQHRKIPGVLRETNCCGFKRGNTNSAPRKIHICDNKYPPPYFYFQHRVPHLRKLYYLASENKIIILAICHKMNFQTDTLMCVCRNYWL
jgi:hypothetical protein